MVGLNRTQYDPNFIMFKTMQTSAINMFSRDVDACGETTEKKQVNHKLEMQLLVTQEAREWLPL